MGGAIVVKPGKKKKQITGATFKINSKIYEATFSKAIDFSKIELPKSKEGKKAVDKGFAKIAKDHGIKIYAVNKEGKKTMVKNPTPEMLATAGKAYVKRTLIASTITKK